MLEKNTGSFFFGETAQRLKKKLMHVVARTKKYFGVANPPMPYARFAHRRSTRGHSRYRRTHYRKKAVAVPKKPKTTRRFTRSNSMAINRLSKQINWLKMSRYGPTQRNFHTSNLMIPFAERPILTDIMDFSCRRATTAGANFAQYNTATPPVLTTVGNWTPSTNLFHADQNLDQPDGGRYLALSCHVTMRFQAVPSITDCRVRVDLFSIKARGITSVPLGQPVFAMPNGILQLTNLANPELNKLGGNPYIKVWSTKWLYLSSSQNRAPAPGGAQNPGPAVTGNSGYLSFTIRPKGGKVRNQLITAPATPQDTIATLDGNWGPFNVPENEPLFLLISCSDVNATGPPANSVSVQCSRSVVWKDVIGKSAL